MEGVPNVRMDKIRPNHENSKDLLTPEEIHGFTRKIGPLLRQESGMKGWSEEETLRMGKERVLETVERVQEMTGIKMPMGWIQNLKLEDFD